MAIATGALALAAASGLFLTRGASAPAVPRVERLGTIAPEVAEAARQALDDLAQNRRDADRWGRFGMICEANGVVGAARDAYATATALPGAQAKWFYRLAYVEGRLGLTDDAIRNVQRAIALDPSYAPAEWRLGSWLLDRNDVDGAERAFRRARDLAPGGMSAVAGLARVYLQRHEDQRAVDLLEGALAKNPGDRYAMQLLGTAYSRLGRAEEADFALTVGAAGEPGWADPWTDEMLEQRRGFAVRLKDATQYFLAGQTGPALALLEQLRQEKPDDITLLGHLGEVYVVAGRAREGVAILEQVVAKDPRQFEAFVNLASGYLKQGDFARARAAIDRAIAVNPALGRAYETKGLILWRSGDERLAAEAFREAIRYDPRDLRALVWLGMVQINLAKPVDALDSFARATHLDPTRTEAWVGIANAAMTLGDRDRAAAALQQAVQLNPDAPEVKQAATRFESLSSRR